MPYGNTVYVSVAFSEIVTISGSTKRINTSWGDLSYVAGDGTNVLTFSGEISTSASGTLSITGLSGTVQDLAGKSFTWSGTETLSTTLDGDLTYDLSDFYTDGSGNMWICMPEPALPVVIFGAKETSRPHWYARFRMTHLASRSWSAAVSTGFGRNSISFCS